MAILAEKFQKAYRKEKILRIGISFLVLLILIALAGIMFMLPSYFSLVLSKNDVLRQLKAGEELFAKKEFSTIEKEIGDINSRIDVYNKNKNIRRAIMPLLARIFAATPSAIRLENVNLDPSQDGFFNISLRGNAKVRDDFLAYKDALATMPEFDSVESPISNLLKESNLEFVLSLGLKKDVYNYVQ